jgi:hypothetical protein
VLDASALVVAGIDGMPPWQARLTFAIARHAAVDLTQILDTRPDDRADRLSSEELDALRRELEAVGLRPMRTPESNARLRELRRSYEPYVVGLGRSLLMPVPPWVRARTDPDNWQTTPKRDGGPHL